MTLSDSIVINLWVIWTWDSFGRVCCTCGCLCIIQCSRLRITTHFRAARGFANPWLSRSSGLYPLASQARKAFNLEASVHPN